jgi:hypothetical protein
MNIILVLAPNLKTSSMKTTKLLHMIGIQFNTLLLNLPIEMEKALIELSFKGMSIDDFVEETRMKKLIPEPISAWEYSVRPILDALPKIAKRFPSLIIRCYGDSKQEFASVNMAVEIARLTLRTMIRSCVNIGEWKEKLLHSLNVDSEIRKSQLEEIIKRAMGITICLTDMGGRCLRDNLTSLGFHVKIRYIEGLYHFTPLMILERLLAKDFVTDEDIERLVRCHIEYIKSYVYKFDNRDRAYYEWVFDKIHWMRERIDKAEIKSLDSIFNGI